MPSGVPWSIPTGGAGTVPDAVPTGTSSSSDQSLPVESSAAATQPAASGISSSGMINFDTRGWRIADMVPR